MVSALDFGAPCVITVHLLAGHNTCAIDVYARLPGGAVRATTAAVLTLYLKINACSRCCTGHHTPPAAACLSRRAGHTTR
jgi:hypothetical protein